MIPYLSFLDAYNMIQGGFEVLCIDDKDGDIRFSIGDDLPTTDVGFLFSGMYEEVKMSLLIAPPRLALLYTLSIPMSRITTKEDFIQGSSIDEWIVHILGRYT